MKTHKAASIPYKGILSDQLQDDPELVAEYLKQAIEDSDPRVFQIALKDVIDALGLNISQLAERTHLNRPNLSNLLSGKNKPHLDTVRIILDALGYRFSIEAKEAS